MHSIKKCLACKTVLPQATCGGYSFCLKCGSANYLSNRTAEADNIEYFNEHFSRPDKNMRMRAMIFSVFNIAHIHFNIRKIYIFKSLVEEINNIFAKSKIAVEIGFGSGDELIKRLDEGCICFGLDLSIAAVEAFKIKHPKYADKVFCEPAGNSRIAANVIYSNALFEHLDEPNLFLRGVHKQLEADGYLILRMPILSKWVGSIEGEVVDINFWEPCHRMLYTADGLRLLLEENGFKILKEASLPYYGYKVMNQLLLHGFESIQQIRCPYFEVPGLSFLTYLKMLFLALFSKLPCVDFGLIAKRI